MQKTILIDDEANSIKLLTYIIEQECPSLKIVGAYTHAEEGLAAVLKEKPDLVFLDIEMPHLNGFELLDKCPNPLPFRLIFTTAYDQYAVRAFRYSALDYLLKPISKTDLHSAINKVLEKEIPAQEQVEILQQFNPAMKKSPTRLTVSTIEGMTFIELEKILYCQSDGAYTKILTESNVPYLVSKPIKEIEEMLDSELFFRIHHSYLVNLKKVQRFMRGESNDAILSDGTAIPVARSRRNDFIAAVSSI